MNSQKPGYYTLKNIFKLNILLVISLLILSSCTTLKQPRLPFKTLSPTDDILKKVLSKGKEINDLKGIAIASITNAEKNYNFKEIIIVQRPSSLRMETLGFFGQPLFFLTSKDNQLSILSLTENKFYRGKFTSDNLSLVLPLYLKPADLFSILLGVVPLIDYIDTDIGLIQDENLYIVRFMQKGGTASQILWIEPFNFSILKSETYDSSGNPALTVKFDNYKIINGFMFPMSTSISLPSSLTNILINYSELEINTGVKSNSFDLDIPPGVEIIYMD